MSVDGQTDGAGGYLPPKISYGTTITIESTWIRRVAVVHRHRRSSSNSVVSMVDGDIGAVTFS